MPAAPINILLVEDNDIDVRAITRAFRRAAIGNPLTVAYDGLEALEVLRGEDCRGALPQPYLVLLDLNMPRMGGIEFLTEVRSDPELRRSIVFVLTTSEDDRDKAAAYDRQVAGYLSKHDAGGAFRNVIDVLELYQTAVHFPPAI